MMLQGAKVNPWDAHVWDALAYLIAILFLGLQIYYAVLPVKQFSWLSFFDNDDAYQTEQFLRLSGEQRVPALMDNPVSHGSEFLWLAPVYGRVASIGLDHSPLRAFQFLKIFHVGCAALALGLLPALFRRSGAPAIVAPVTGFLLATHRLFFTNVPLLKADSNVVLLCCVMSLWALFHFDDKEQQWWLWVSLAFAALGAAVKWWGAFLLPAIYWTYLKTKSGDRPLLSPKSMILFSIPLAVFWIMVLMNQMEFVRANFPKYDLLLPRSSTVAAAVIFGFSSLVLSYHRCLQRKATRAFAAGGAILFLFGGMFTFWQLPLLLGPEFAHSVRYFSKFIILSPTSGDPGMGLFRGVVHNIFLWLNMIFSSGYLRWSLIPIFLVSILIIYKKKTPSSLREKWAIIFLSIAPLFCFLGLFVTKINPPTLSLTLPFFLALLLIPSAFFFMNELRFPFVHGKWVWLGLCLLTGGIQAMELKAVIREGVVLPERVELLNAQIKSILPVDQPVVVNGVGREFPWQEGRFPVVSLTLAEMKENIALLNHRCQNRPSSAQEKWVLVVLKDGQERLLFADGNEIVKSPCVRGSWEWAGQTVSRGERVNYKYTGVLFQTWEE